MTGRLRRMLDRSDRLGAKWSLVFVAIAGFVALPAFPTLGVALLTFFITLAVSTDYKEERAKKTAHEKDLDETRRLLYTARLAHVNPQWEGRYALYGSLVNSLAHHSKVYSQVAAMILGDRLVSGQLPDEEILRLILLITDELGDSAPEESKQLPPIPGSDEDESGRQP